MVSGVSHVLASSIFWVAAAVCAIAQVAILRSALRARTTAGAGTATRQSSPAAELLWVLLPALMLCGTLLLTWRALGATPVDPDPRADRAARSSPLAAPPRIDPTL